MIRVLIADDQRLVRAGVAMILNAADGVEVVGEAADGAEAVRLAERLHPDVILMDIRMPGVDGIEAARRILAARPLTRIVMLTTFADDENVYEALRTGAIGFLVKDDDPEHMLAAVRRATDGEPALAPSVLRRVVAHALDARDKPGSDALDVLTDREREVLALLGAGRSNAEIAAELHVGVTTVKSHVSAVTDKLGIRNRVQAAVLAHRLGLVDADFTPSRPPGRPGPGREPGPR